jgi:hypothetical protein
MMSVRSIFDFFLSTLKRKHKMVLYNKIMLQKKAKKISSTIFFSSKEAKE